MQLQIFQAIGKNALTIEGALTNSGTLDVARSGLGGTLAGLAAIEGGVTNTGTVRIDPGARLTVAGGSYAQSAGSTDVDGTLIAPSMDITGGVLKSGGGVVETQMLTNGASLTADVTGFIGVGTGPFRAATGYQQQADGTLDELISSANNFGVITVAGAASLNGTLDVTLENGFIPVVGDQFAFLNFTPDGLTGTFSSFLGQTFDNGLEKWALTYDNSGGSVYLTAPANSDPPTPEPASLLLLGAGLLASIIHVFEDKKSLLGYKHVVKAMFERPKEALTWLTISQHSVCCSRKYWPSPGWRNLTSGRAVPTAARSC